MFEVVAFRPATGPCRYRLVAPEMQLSSSHTAGRTPAGKTLYILLIQISQLQLVDRAAEMHAVVLSQTRLHLLVQQCLARVTCSRTPLHMTVVLSIPSSSASTLALYPSLAELGRSRSNALTKIIDGPNGLRAEDRSRSTSCLHQDTTPTDWSCQSLRERSYRSRMIRKPDSMNWEELTICFIQRRWVMTRKHSHKKMMFVH